MSNRRDFLKRVAVVGSVAASAGAMAHALQPEPDEFDYRGWHVRWRGWREPHNQLVRFGVWHATRYPEEQSWYATTMGVVDTLTYPTSVMDLYIADRNAPHVPGLHSEAAFAEVKQRARRRLLEKLDG